MSDVDDRPDDTPEFRSPKRCLARSFRLSRDRWKFKATQRREQVKALQVKARDLEASRDLWKAKALHLQAQLADLLGVVGPPVEPPALGHTDQVAPPPDPTPPAPPAPDAPDAPEDAPPKKARRARPCRLRPSPSGASRPCPAATTT